MRWESNFSVTLTSVASQGPLFLTVTVNMIESPRYTTFDSTLTVLLISKSTASIAVMFGMLALLLEAFVSFSLPNIATKLVKFPGEITSAMIVRF